MSIRDLYSLDDAGLVAIPAGHAPREFGPTSGRTPNGRRWTFTPYGPVYVSAPPPGAMRSNPPSAWRVRYSFLGFLRKPVYAARIIVGLSVGLRVTWTTLDVANAFREVRRRQYALAGSSFGLLFGLYQEDLANDVVQEPSVMITVTNYTEALDAFIDQTYVVAERVADRLHQQVVIVEILRNGIVADTSLVWSDPRYWTSSLPSEAVIAERDDRFRREFD